MNAFRKRFTTAEGSKFLWVMLVPLLLFPSGRIFSQTDSLAGSPVIVDGKILFRITYGVQGHSSDQRAQLVAQRVELAATDFSVDTDSIRAVDWDIATAVMAGDKIMIMLFDPDTVKTGMSRAQLAAAYASEVRNSIEEHRAARSSSRILTGVLWSLLATALLWAGLYLLSRATRKIREAIHRRIRSVRIGAQEVIQASWVETVLFFVTKIGRVIVTFLLLYFYLSFVLNQFIWTWSVAQRLLSLVINPLRTLWVEFVGQLPNLFFMLVLIALARYVIKLTKFFFQEIEKGSVALPNFHADWAKPTFKMVRALIILLTAVIIYPYIPGSSSAAFQGISIFMGLLFSLGSSSAVANVVAGTILTYMRAFKVGDVVLIGDARGAVVETTLLITRIRTAKNVEIAIPNSSILNSQVTNFSNQAKSGLLILPTAVSIGYDTPWRQVHAMLKMAADKTPGILKNPEPFILQLMLDDFYVKYELNVYVDTAMGMLNVYSELHKNIQDAFNEYGVQIMSPHYESATAEPVFVPKARWYSAPAKEGKNE